MSRTRRTTFRRPTIRQLDASAIRGATQQGREAAAAGASERANPYDRAAVVLRIAWESGFHQESRMGRGMDRGPRVAGEGADFDRSGA